MSKNNFTTQSIPLEQLTLHPDNVRHRKSDADKIKPIAASIASIGLINPLTVTLINKDADEYGVLAGGRRLQALEMLAADGILSDAYHAGVPCQVFDSHTSATEISLSENTQREDMTAYDQIIAWGQLAGEGLDIATITARFGTTEHLVKQRLALANVIPEVLELLRDESISLDTVKAFTLSADHAQQRAALEHCGLNPQQWQVKSFLTSDTITMNNRLAKCVGLEAYIAAGGTLTQDLFGETATILHDEDILNDLLAEKLEVMRKDWLAKGWSWVKVETDEGFDDARFGFSCIQGEAQNPTDAEAIRMDKIQEAINLVEEGVENGTDAETLYDELNQIEAAVDSRTIWPDEIMAKGGVLMGIDYDGDISISPGWVERKAPDGSSSGSSSITAGSATSANAETPQTYNGSHLADLERVRTRIVHANLLNDNVLINDILAFQLALSSQNHHEYLGQDRFGAIQIGTFYLQQNDAASDETSLPQGKAIAKHVKTLKTDWLKPTDIHQRFALFRKLKPEQKQAWLNWAVAGSINVGLDTSAGQIKSQPFDGMIAELNIDWAAAWRPDETFFSRLSKAKILEMLTPVLSDEWAAGHSATKKSALVTIVAGIIAGKAKSLTPEQQAGVENWSPTGFWPSSNEDEDEADEEDTVSRLVKQKAEEIGIDPDKISVVHIKQAS